MQLYMIHYISDIARGCVMLKAGDAGKALELARLFKGNNIKILEIEIK